MANTRPLSVIGIDPGTTVGFAVLSLYNEIIEIGSEKNFSLDNLVQRISEKSKPILVGCDKLKVPKFVEKFAARTGAKIIVPKEDMKLSEKRRITATFNCKNHHQEDALASALCALKKSKGLLDRVDKLIPSEDIHMLEEVKSKVVKEKIAVKKAVEMLKLSAV